MINKDFVLDLNGYTISAKYGLLDISKGVANVEIYDSKNSGGMYTNSENHAVIIVNDYKTNCTIKSGTYMGTILAFTPFADPTRQNTSIVGGITSENATFSLAEDYPYVEIIENAQNRKVLRVLSGAKAGIVKVNASFGGHTIVQEINTAVANPRHGGIFLC